MVKEKKFHRKGCQQKKKEVGAKISDKGLGTHLAFLSIYGLKLLLSIPTHNAGFYKIISTFL